MLARDRPMPTTTAIAPAKINLFLRVLGRRPDGYHDLESLVVPISLADRLEIHAASDPEFRTLSFSLEVSGDPDTVRGVPVDESNLVLRAAKALADRAGVRGFADIRLEKAIPAAAGLGGGSSDAAATLRTLNELWEAGLSEQDLFEVAAEIGSDVPAMLREGAVLMEGRGDRVVGRPVPGPLSGVLATFGFGVQTRDAFGWWDSDGGTTGPDPRRLLESLSEAPEGFGPLLFNDLEEPVTRRHPEIGRVKEALVRGGAAGVLMAGSGPTVFGLLDTGSALDPEARREVDELTGRPVMDVAVGRLPVV
jgi:4-diphosphocytidyl-2-C-methyl-D-erythritol kinase